MVTVDDSLAADVIRDLRIVFFFIFMTRLIKCIRFLNTFLTICRSRTINICATSFSYTGKRVDPPAFELFLCA